jgi:hypothetical protein
MAAAAAAGARSLQQQRQQQGKQAQASSGLPGLAAPGGITVDDAFNLTSRPGSRFKLVLDFDGNSLQGNAWNVAQGVDKIVTGPYDKDGDPKRFNLEEITGVQPLHVPCRALSMVGLF